MGNRSRARRTPRAGGRAVVEILPHRLARAGCALAAVVILVPLWTEPVPLGARLLLTALLVRAGLRSFRAGVAVGDDVEVRGYLWSRRVPRASVLGVTGFPSVVWRDAAGRRHRSPILALMANPRGMPRVERERDARVEQLRRLLRGYGTG